ncbi:SPOSA6832_03505 [Sporobolomyces salmonicolor]|uniref:SPOSA6832_03505-mRNA-1:cds n=1 Tax=Sporidiobolus salmonicolor TaxID=5005 RepID=A0A0D6ENX8_SPOSA|nr:SPOSA6832_03505 [Sporobolomyces salmonicolor]
MHELTVRGRNRYYYDSRYAEALEALGLGSDGTPKASGMDRETGEALAWQPDKGEMVGAAGRQALGHVLKTVDEVYAAMREKAVSEIQSDQRAILAVRVRRGQYQMWEKDVDGRFEAALELFKSALDEVGPIIAEVTTEIHAAWKGRKKDRSRTGSTDATTDDVAGALQVGFQNDQGQDDEFLTEKERAFARSLSGLRNRLRDLLFVQHSAWFFTGHANFKLEDMVLMEARDANSLKREKEETEAYAQAERLRQIILQPYENHVEKAQATLREQLDARNEDKPLEATDLELSFNKRGHGLVAIDVFEDIEITSDILNGCALSSSRFRKLSFVLTAGSVGWVEIDAELVAQYREMIIEMMLKPVSIAGDDATGEEYEERAVLQEQLIVYLEAYTVLVGEWNYGITGTRSFLYARVFCFSPPRISLFIFVFTIASADQYKAEAAAVLYREENLLPEAPPPPNGIEVEAALNGTFDEMIDAVGGVARPGASGRAGRKRRAVEAELDSEDGDKQDDEEEDKMDEHYEGQAKREKAKGEGQAEKTDKQNKALQEKTRTQKKRGANIRNNSYKDFVAPTVENGHAPADVLRYELLVERLEAKGEGREKTEVIPLRHLIKALKDAAEQSSKQQEIALLDSERARISKRLGPLEKVADQLTLELGDFNKSMNARIEYFRQLQEVSDSVADPDMGAKKWRGLLIEIEMLRIDESEFRLLPRFQSSYRRLWHLFAADDLKQALAQREQRRRYLDNLSAPEERELDQTCPICAEYFTDGILTQECAHLLCRDCFRLWYARSKNCAMCKTPLAPGSWTAVKYRRKDDTLQPTDEDKELPERDETKFVDSKGVLRGFETKTPPLAELDQAEIDRIREIETTVPLSSKSDFIVKHVKLLRRRDPEAKIVIFSAWQDALQLLMEAFSRNGIQYVRLEGASGKGKKEGVVKRFINDPDIAAFFLHTKSQSAGLTLTNAQYVMLVEPLLQPSLELQAVARVHRIGQTKETTVFQYTVNDTPDKRVAELRARQNTSLFLADQQLDALKESRLGQQKGLASKEARKETRHVEEAIDDEDDIARCLLAPEAFVNLQRALLPFRLRDAQPSVAAADRNFHGGSAARGHRMGMAGMAAAGRAAGAADASASGSGSGGGLNTL